MTRDRFVTSAATLAIFFVGLGIASLTAGQQASAGVGQASAGAGQASVGAGQASVGAGLAPPSKSGIELASLDRSANACTDFYEFACGGWVKAHPRPADQPRYGRFDDLQERNNAVLRDIMEKTAKGASDADDRKIGDYYGSCLNESEIDAKGLAPLKADLDAVAAVGKAADLPPLVAALHAKGVGVFFGFGAVQDFKDASSIMAIAGQGGMGLPDRDYYLKDDGNKPKVREEYEAHVKRVLQLAGDSPDKAAAGAKTVMTIETALARAALDIVSRRNPASIYHKMTVAELAALTPAFDWAVYLRGLQAPPIQSVNVSEPEFMKAVDRLLSSTPIDDLRVYMRWQVLSAQSDFMPKAFRDENFAFAKVLTGAEEQRPRWKRCVDATNGDLGEIVGKAYVAQTFGADGKERTLKMVHAIEDAMQRDIDSITWMSDASKKEALTKLKAVANKIGYPDKWRDYSALQIVRGDALGNSLRANTFAFQRQLNKIGKPVDKTEWLMTPPTVNAYYNPLENNINFPAGILQPPFFNRTADDAVNFGAAGAVVGHELTHGFDDQGRRFDAQGNLRDWWTPADGKAFEERAACIDKQYSGYTAVGDVKLNGKLTLGENAADNGGLRLGWMALQEAMKAKPIGEADGFTPEQRFFIGWAQMWCENKTDEFARMHAATNPHSPGRHRTNGVVSNFPEFAKAFGCAPDSPMVNQNACRVW